MSINHSATQLLDQLASVIKQLSDEQFRKPVGTLSQSSIGQHVRHTLEFFICLMNARDKGTINYDKRNHDTAIQEEVALAVSVINSIQAFIRQEQHDFSLTLEANYELEGNENIVIPSNFFRELAYNIEHAIHHMALIKIGINDSCPEVMLPEHFGVASSTIRYQKNQYQA